MAKLAMQAERRQDALEFIENMLSLKNSNFTEEERLLVMSTFKDSIQQDRNNLELLQYLIKQNKLKKFETPMRI